MRVLSKTQINTAPDIKREFMPTPEWDDAPDQENPAGVFVRSATAFEMDEYEGSLTTTKMVGDKAEVVGNWSNAKARLVAKCLVDEDGSPIGLTDIELGKKNADPINRLFKKIQELSGKAKGAQATIAKNSVADQS